MKLKIKMKATDAVDYQRLYVAVVDIGTARSYAQYLLKKGWHGWPVLRRGSVRVQQGAFTEALIIAYGRLWSPEVLKGFVWSDVDDISLHDCMLRLRNKVVGHSVPISYTVKPWVSDEFSTHIFGQPHLHFTRVELKRLDDMLVRFITEIQDHRLALLTTYVGPEKAKKMLAT
ncbi:MAG: hypothetical protein II336_19095 [Loktanella sp.]|nr:hypothetical protein [Loktanella sp.]